MRGRGAKEEASVKNSAKVFIFCALGLAVFLLNRCYGWSEYWGNVDNFLFIRTMARRNLPAAVGLYVAVTVVGSVVLALPGVTFAVFAGILFGPLLGTLCCTVAATAGAAAAFLLGRYFLRDAVRPKVMKNPRLKRLLFDETGKNQMLLLMITRLVPLFPYNLQNFAYGITDMKFFPYTAGSFVFMSLGTAMYTFGAAGLFDGRRRAFYLTVAGALAAALTILGVYLKKRFLSARGAAQGEEPRS